MLNIAQSTTVHKGNGRREYPKLDKTLTSETILVTPEIAKAWLDKNTKNRNVAHKAIDSYARDMANKKWLLTGDAIRFDKKGNLLDGQHRLRACIRANTPFPSLVIYSLDSEVQDQIDTGKPRKASDILALNGFHNTHLLAACARLIQMMKDNTANARTKKLTISEINATVKKHPGLHRSIILVANTVGPPRSMLAVTHYIASQILGKEKRADAFMQVFVTGVPDYEGCPAQKLREKLLRQKTTKEVVKRDLVFKLLQHSWNLFAKRKELDRLRGGSDTKFDGLDISKL